MLRRLGSEVHNPAHFAFLASMSNLFRFLSAKRRHHSCTHAASWHSGLRTQLWAFIMSLMSPVRPNENSVMGINRAFRHQRQTFNIHGRAAENSGYNHRHSVPLAKAFKIVVTVVSLRRCRGDGCSIYLPSALSFALSITLRKSTLGVLPKNQFHSFSSPSKSILFWGEHIFLLLQQSTNLSFSSIKGIHSSPFKYLSLCKT